MQMEYQIDLVLFSVLTATFSCAAALYLLRGINGLMASYRIIRILLAAFVFATGTWAMHFIGMLSMKMPISVTFNSYITVASYLFVVAGAIPAMIIINNKAQTVLHRFIAAICLSVSICIMHFSGMSSMQMQPIYQATWVAISILAAFLASYIILWACQNWRNKHNESHVSFALNSIMLGTAVSSMHYIGMMTAHFNLPDFSFLLNDEGFTQERLAYLTGTLTILTLLILTFTTIQQKRVTIWQPLLIVGIVELSIMLLMPVLMPKGTSTEIESLVDMGFLMVFISPIAWRLRQTSHHLFEAKLVVEKNLQTQNAINQLLSLQSDLLSKDDLFNQALDVFFTIDWLMVEHKGAIFLNNPNAESLTMVAHTGLSEFLIRGCTEVIRTYCLCGEVAFDWNIIHSSQVDSTHCKYHLDTDQHEHYIVPLISEKKLKGVLCLFLQTGHEYDANEVDTLKVLGATLAELIRAKQSMIQLGLADTVFMHSLTCLMVADAENRILSINPAFTNVTGYTIEDVKGKHPTIFSSGLQKDDFYKEMWQELSMTGSWQGEAWDKRKNGEHYLEWLSIAEVRDHNDQVQNYIAAFADITDQKEAEKRIIELAYYDNLTGLANRTLFYDRFNQSIIHAKRHNTQLALLFIDLDRFKDVNDALGHATGDSFLKIVASRIGHCLRESDVLARLGGDEFVVILKDLDDAAFSVTESVMVN